MNKQDCYYIFDFEDKVKILSHDLEKVLGKELCEIRAVGNTYKSMDSYCWNLSNMLFDMRNDGKEGIFDVVYLDGAYSFAVDGLATCLLKELLKPGGYIVFDGLYWTFCSSTYLESVREEMFTQEMLEDAQIRRVVNAFMINDRNFEHILNGNLNERRVIYRKIM